MEDNKIIVNPTVKRVPAVYRGPFSSKEYNDQQDAVVKDIVNLSTAVNTNANALSKALQYLYAENQYLKRSIFSLQKSLEYRETNIADNFNKVDRFIDFHSNNGVIFLSDIPESKRALVDTKFGEIYLPINAVENKFYSFSLRNNIIVLPDDLNVNITSLFDKQDGNGIKDYEYNGKVSEGNIKNAFNGIEENNWVRSVTFPLESDVEEVEVELTAVVPENFSNSANVIEIVPFPEGSVDITHLSTAADLSSSFQVVDNFVEKNNIIATRYHFSPRFVEQVKIRLRSRNWLELNGKKVFLYGLQELGMKLIDYSKYNTTVDTLGSNITAVVKIDAPSNYTFKSLYAIDTFPNFFNEDSSNRHIILRLSTTPNYNGIFWHSSNNVLPQEGLSSGVSMGNVESIYAIYTLRFVDASSGLNSPFPVGTSPIISGLGLKYSLAPSN